MRLILAGAQNPSFLPLLVKAKCPHVLMTWWALRKNKKKAIEKLEIAKQAGMTLLLDSGAHSFYNEYSHLDPRQKDRKAQADRRFIKQKQTSREDLLRLTQEYMDEYIEFLKDHSELVTAFAELDIDGLVARSCQTGAVVAPQREAA